MHSNSGRALPGLLAAGHLAAVLLACTRTNPAFEADGGGGSGGATSGDVGGGTTTTGSSGGAGSSSDETGGSQSGGATTGASNNVDPSTGAPTTVDATSTTTDASTTSASTTLETTTAADDTTAAQSTGEADPTSAVVLASLATCVLLQDGAQPYAGPKECEPKAEAEDGAGLTGVMIVDTEFINQGANDRPARIFMRFDLPAALLGKVLLSATLQLRVSASESAGAEWSGTLRGAGPFDVASLDAGPPATLLLAAGDPGACEPGDLVSWKLSTIGLLPGQSLYLALTPKDDDGVMYRSSRAEEAARPRLVIDYL